MLTAGNVIFFVFAFMGGLFFVPGHCDVIISAIDKNDFINVSMDLQLFKEFYSCLCDIHDKCLADYNNKNVVNKVLKEDDEENRDMVYYFCEKVNRVQRIRCQLKSSEPEASVSQTLTCHNPNVSLHWSSTGEGIIFSNPDICQTYCAGGCNCPTTTSTTTWSTATTKTTTINTTTTTTATTTTTTYTFSTSASATQNYSKNDSDNDPPSGLIIGVVTAVIFIAIIIAIIIVFVWRRKHTQNTTKPPKETNNITDVNGFSNTRSLTQNGFTDLNSNSSPYAVPSSSFNYDSIDDNTGVVPSSITYQYAKLLNENLVNEAKASSVASENGSNTAQKKPAQNKLKNDNEPGVSASDNRQDKTHEVKDPHVYANTKFNLTSGEKGEASKVMSPVDGIKSVPKSSGAGYELAHVMEESDEASGEKDTSLSKQDTGETRDDHDYCVIRDAQDVTRNDTIQPKSALPSDKKDDVIETSALRDGEYGNLTDRDQDKEKGDYQSAAISPYEFTGGIESQNKDSGYEYAGPDYTCDTDTANKDNLLNKKNIGAYEMAENINSSIDDFSADPSKNTDPYSRLHEENRQVKNPYNTLLDVIKDPTGSTSHSGAAYDSQSANQPADQSKNIYSKLHAENRQVQNPYNTMVEAVEDHTGSASSSGSTHDLPSANQPSRYSFAQPTFDRMSNKKTDDIVDVNDVVTSQNHTYHVIKASVDQGTDRGGGNSDVCNKKRNTYFELEKQEDVSDSERDDN